MQFIQDHSVVILAALLAISELLSLNPKIKSNGIFQFVYNLLKGKVEKKPE